MAKPESFSFKLPRLLWLTLDKQHGLGATTPARLLPSPLQVTHPPKPLTHCQRRCCSPRAKLSVPRNNRAISELPSTPTMLPHLSPPPKRQGSNIRGVPGRKSNSTEGNNPKPHRLSCGGGRWLHCNQDMASEGAAPTLEYPSAVSLQKCFRGDRGAAIF